LGLGPLLIRRRFPRGSGGGEPPIITATVAPALGVLSDGDAIEDAFSANIASTGNYASTAGTISSAVVAVTVNAVSASQTDLIEAGDVVAVTVTVTDSEANERVWSLSTTAVAIAPAQFTSNMWSVAVNELTLSSLPDDGGSALTDIEYNVDGGAWTSTGETTTGTYTITAADGTAVRIRAVNAIGAGTQSDAKTVTADAYTIGGNSPELVVSYVKAEDGTTDGEYFRSGGVAATSAIVTSSVPTVRTMHDSTGKLVWNPHNFVPSSNDFTVGWSPVFATITTDAITAFGLSGIKLVSASGQTRNEIYDVLPVSSVPRRLRIVAKAAEWSWLFVMHDGPNANVYFDLANGVVGAQNAGGVGEITSLGDGWYACDFISPNWTSGRRVFISCTNANNVQSTGDGTSGIYLLCANQWDDRLPMAANPDAPDAALPWYVETTGTTKYLPRREAYYYNGTVWAKGGMLVESAEATNLVTYSRDLTNAAWTKSSATVAKNATGIDGVASSACTVTSTAVAGSAFDSVSIATDTATYTASFYVPYEASPSIYPAVRMNISGGTAVNATVIVDPSDGSTVVVSGSGTVSSRREGDWWRVRITNANNSTNDTVFVYYYPAYSDNGSTFSSITGAKAVDQIQLEIGSLPSSPIITTGSTVTRTAETATIAGADTPANTTAISISMKGLMTWAGEDGRMWNLYKDANNRFSTIRLADGRAYLATRVGGTNRSFVPTPTYAQGVNIPFNVASRATGAGTSNAATSGTSGTAAASLGLPDFSTGTTLFLFKYATGIPVNGFISEFRMWGTDIGDSGIEEVTS
jgi:hypothetical protein